MLFNLQEMFRCDLHSFSYKKKTMTNQPSEGHFVCKNVTLLPKYGVLLKPNYGQKKVPYAEMRFFFCTHAWLYDLPTRQLTLCGWPPRWQ